MNVAALAWKREVGLTYALALWCGSVVFGDPLMSDAEQLP